MRPTFRLLVGIMTLPALLAAPPSSFGAEASTGGRVATVTRLVKLFLDKEALLSATIRSANAPALGALLTDDFELRTGSRAASPVPRAEWMHEVLRTREPGGDISRMAVHDYGVIAVVSFTQDAAGGSVFVVDVWRAQGPDWKLAVRYANPVGSPAFPIPGAVGTEPEIPKKY